MISVMITPCQVEADFAWAQCLSLKRRDSARREQRMVDESEIFGNERFSFPQHARRQRSI
jgi:hypothetical protein